MFFQKISNYEFKIQEIQENPNSSEEKKFSYSMKLQLFLFKKVN